MKSALPVAALLLLAVTGTDGLKCVACRPNRKIGGTSIPSHLEAIVNKMPLCSQLNPKDPELEFEMHCGPGHNTCAKIRDERGNEMRACFKAPSTGCIKAKKGQVFCKCRGDFCNTAAVSTPALLTLLAPLAAALLRLH